MSNNIFKWHTSQFVLLPHPCYLREVKILNSNIHRLILHIEEAVRPRTQSCFVTLSRQSTSEHAAYICGKLRLHGPKRRSTRAGVVVRVPAFQQWSPGFKSPGWTPNEAWFCCCYCCFCFLREVSLRVLRISSVLQNPQIPIWTTMCFRLFGGPRV